MRALERPYVMKAIAYTRFGPPDVLELIETEKPAPKDNEVLVGVQAASINALEWRRFTLPSGLIRVMTGGVRRPKDIRIGSDFSGRIEAVGASVKQFRPGDDVYGVRRGAFAEYVCAPENFLAPKPAGISFEAAAAVPVAALTALQGVRDQGKIRPGQQVLIYGAGGGVGTFAVQIAKSFGTEVTAVCGARNLDIARSIGADHVMDYAREGFTLNRQQYDLIIAANGYRSIFEYRRALKPHGIYVVLGGSMTQMLQGMLLAPLLSRTGDKKMTGVLTNANQRDLIVLKELIEAGKVVPVVDRCYPLSDVREAIRYVLQGHARGKVVLTVKP